MFPISERKKVALFFNIQAGSVLQNKVDGINLEVKGF